MAPQTPKARITAAFLAAVLAGSLEGCSRSEQASAPPPYVDAERGLSRQEMLSRSDAELAAGHTGSALRLIAKNTDAGARLEPEVAAQIARVREAIVTADGEQEAKEMVAANFADGAYPVPR